MKEHIRADLGRDLTPREEYLIELSATVLECQEEEGGQELPKAA